MVVVRSSATSSLMAAGIGGLQRGQDLEHAVDGGDDVGAGLTEDDDEDGGLAVDQAAGVDVFDGIDDVGDVAARAATGGAVAVGDDAAVVVSDGFDELVGGGRWPRSRSCVIGRGSPLGVVGVGAAPRAVARRRSRPSRSCSAGGIGLDPDGGLGSAADVDLADARDLRDLLGEDGVGGVVICGMVVACPR